MPRGSLRCLRKKYSSHQRLKRGYLSAPNGASASRQAAVEVPRVLLEAVVRRQVHAAAEPADRLAPRRQATRRACARSCAPSARTGCAGGRPATRPSPRTARRPARGRCCVADGGSGVAAARARSCSRRARAARRLRRSRDSAVAFERCAAGLALQASLRNGVAVLGLERARRCAAAGRAGSRGRRVVDARSCAVSCACDRAWPMSRRYCAPSKRMPASAS